MTQIARLRLAWIAAWVCACLSVLFLPNGIVIGWGFAIAFVWLRRAQVQARQEHDAIVGRIQYGGPWPLKR